MENPKSDKIRIEVTTEVEGLRLDKALSMNMQIRSRTRAEALIKEGRVLVNGKTCKSSFKVSSNDIIEIELPHEKASTLNKLAMPLDVKFEDEHLIVINKPPGLVVHPSAGHENDTLVNALMAHSEEFVMKFAEPRPGIVHRLDKDTSGLLVVAKNDLVLDALAQQFKNRNVHRIYQAITVGHVPSKKGRICSFLARHPVDRKRYASVLGSDKKPIRDINQAPNYGKWAVTNYEVLTSHQSGLILVQLKLETGRTHQIRVHLSEAGMPIISDPVYGSPKKEAKIVGNKAKELLLTSERCALHAKELGFNHPVRNTYLSFNVDWPDHHLILDYIRGS